MENFQPEEEAPGFICYNCPTERVFRDLEAITSHYYKAHRKFKKSCSDPNCGNKFPNSPERDARWNEKHSERQLHRKPKKQRKS
ncbi:hypothetical protein SLEP1_g31809 [Rubroshorea leprosula]|uniref:C2H2-type domain-containing protein n=1 Tax=Rubroshorea leprosula TaxID=152421 RepID=A0AAV5KBC1_9ROSI|nr:hypothetical protein SLEP1_g31809 [Rubroshorea leprosula]